MSNQLSPFLIVEKGEAPKLGRNGGCVQFAVIINAEDSSDVFISIIGNDAGGYWSQELVSINQLADAMPSEPAEPFKSKVFARAFKSKSANDPSFAAAVLKSLGLITPAEGKPYCYLKSGDWRLWADSALVKHGEPYAPPTKAGSSGMTKREGEGLADVVAPEHRRGRKPRPPKSVEFADADCP